MMNRSLDLASSRRHVVAKVPSKLREDPPGKALVGRRLKHFQLHVIIGLRTYKITPNKTKQKWLSNKCLARSSRVTITQQHQKNSFVVKNADSVSELQMQYSNFKDTLQNIASQIGNVEQEVEEHK